MDKIVEYYIIGGCLLVWMGFSAWGIHIVRTKWHVFRFKSIEATITNLELREVSVVPSNEFSSSHIAHKLLMKYIFDLDGRHIRGTGEGGYFEYPNGTYQKRENGEKPLFLAEKKVGDTITVYYNPQNPKENYLHRQFVLGGFIVIGFAQVFLALAIGLVDKWL